MTEDKDKRKQLEKAGQITHGCGILTQQHMERRRPILAEFSCVKPNDKYTFKGALNSERCVHISFDYKNVISRNCETGESDSSEKIYLASDWLQLRYES